MYETVLPNKLLVPKELLEIQQWWRAQTKEIGDIGPSAIAPGMRFAYQGTEYMMPPLSHWQGAHSWEPFTNEVKKRLESIGAIDVWYDPGMMD